MSYSDVNAATMAMGSSSRAASAPPPPPDFDGRLPLFNHATADGRTFQVHEDNDIVYFLFNGNIQYASPPPAYANMTLEMLVDFCGSNPMRWARAYDTHIGNQKLAANEMAVWFQAVMQGATRPMAKAGGVTEVELKERRHREAIAATPAPGSNQFR